MAATAIGPTAATTGTHPGNGTWERPKAARGAALLLAVVGLGGAAVAGMLPVRDTVETRLEQRADEALDAAGIDGVTVDASGRDLVVSGTVASEAAASGALDVVEAETGVRVAESALVVAAPPTEDSGAGLTADLDVPQLEVRAEGGLLVLSGTVASAAEARAVREAAVAVAGPDGVDDGLVVDDAIAPMEVGRLASVVALVDALGSEGTVADGAGAALDGDDVTLFGSVPASTAEAVRDVAPDVVGGEGSLDDGLTVSEQDGDDAATAGQDDEDGSAAAGDGEDPAGTDTDDAADALAPGDVVGPQVLFAKEDATLDDDATAAVDDVVAALGDTSAVVVTGFTDPRGRTAYNAELSQRRAEAVAARLVELVPELEVEVVAGGVAGDDGDDDAKRRVEVTVAG